MISQDENGGGLTSLFKRKVANIEAEISQHWEGKQGKKISDTFSYPVFSYWAFNWATAGNETTHLQNLLYSPKLSVQDVCLLGKSSSTLPVVTTVPIATLYIKLRTDRWSWPNTSPVETRKRHEGTESVSLPFVDCRFVWNLPLLLSSQ